MTHHISNRGSSSRTRHSGVAEELMRMVDQHLAWQTSEIQLRSVASQETLFVDWDGCSEPQMSYRDPRRAVPRISYSGCLQGTSCPSSPCQMSPIEPCRYPKPCSQHGSVLDSQSPTFNPHDHQRLRSTAKSSQNPHNHCRVDKALPTHSAGHSCRSLNELCPVIPLEIRRKTNPPATTKPTDDALTVKYHPPRSSHPSHTPNQAYVSGYDPATSFDFDYNGQIMHVHRSPTYRTSKCSEYYAVDADKYSAGTSVRIDDKTAPETPHVQKKREIVGGFVTKVLGKLERVGIMDLFRQERRRKRMGYGKGREASWARAECVS